MRERESARDFYAGLSSRKTGIRFPPHINPPYSMSLPPTFASTAVSLAIAVSLAMLAVLLLAARPACAQPLADTLVSWRGYARVSTAQVQVYPAPPGDERRDRTIVIRELAGSRGPSTVDDVSYLADLVGRHLRLDPARAYWILHWGAFSFPDAQDGKELFLRVTFRRTSSGRLSSPHWRALSHVDVLELTDRRYQSPATLHPR